MYTRYKRGLIIALLIIFIYNVQVVNAATVDDLRRYLGLDVKDSIEEIDYDIDIEKDINIESIYNSRIESLEGRLEELSNSYGDRFKAGVGFMDLIYIVYDIERIHKQIEDLKDLKAIGSVDVVGMIEHSMSLSDDINSREDVLGSKYFNIGTIGDDAISPANDYLKLITPYGYKLKPDGTYEDKNVSIDLALSKNIPVLSQWNGRVSEIVEDSNVEGCSVVKIYHGDNLYTIYHHIKPKELYVGKNVIQGEIIGYIGDTTKSESLKENHLTYEIVLDNKNINPLIIFGNRGKTIYENWLNSTIDVYTVEEGEEFYYVPSMSNNSEDEGKNTIKGAAKVIGDYRKPDPGLVDIDINMEYNNN